MESYNPTGQSEPVSLSSEMCVCMCVCEGMCVCVCVCVHVRGVDDFLCVFVWFGFLDLERHPTVYRAKGSLLVDHSNRGLKLGRLCLAKQTP